jgi:hypothetical protein
MNMSRRELLENTSALSLISLLPNCIVPTRADASAVVAVAFAVAAAVAGLIAAHNRRNVNTLLIAATREELSNVSLQLSSLQTASPAMLATLANLPSAFAKALSVQSTRELQRDLLAAVALFDEQRHSLPLYRNDEQTWLKAPHQKENLGQVSDKIRFLRAQLEKSDIPIDPTACIVMASAAPVELALRTQCGYDSNSTVTTIELYEAYFAKVKNAALSDSTARYLNDSTKAKAAIWNSITTDAIGKTLDHDGNGAACVVADDYTAPYRRMVSPPQHHFGGVGDMPPYEPAVWEQVAARQGRLTRLSMKIRLETVRADSSPEFDLALRQIESAIKQPLNRSELGLSLKRLVVASPVMDSRAANASWPAGPALCYAGRHDLSAVAPKDLLATLQKLPEWKQYETAIVRLDQLVADFNLEAAKVEFATQASACADATLAMLSSLKRSY